MINIPLKVTGSQLIQEETVNIASGCSNSVQVTLAIDPASDFADSTLKKRAVFRYYQGSYFISDVDENNQVVVPKFVIAYPYFKVTLRAQNEDKALTITTNEIQIPVSKSPTLYESTIVDGDVNVRNNDGALAISKSGDVVYINFAAAYKTAVDAVIAGTYATASALNLVTSDVDSIKEDVIDMSNSISDLQGDIADLGTAKADKDDVYTKGETEALLAEKQPVGNYATLENGKILASQLPSYVDDVLEYASISQFPVQGENGVIYIALDTNKTYRWGGTNYVEISESLALGETASTAYPGNKGKANADAITTLQTEVANIKDGTTHLFENITDKHGNPRFVEGDITMNTITGVTQTYGKWSLSGTHLMIVVSGTIASNTKINNLLNIELPNYIMDKIKPLFATNYIEMKTFQTYANDWSTQAMTVQSAKINNRFVVNASGSGFTATKDRAFRIQFDILIDDE